MRFRLLAVFISLTVVSLSGGMLVLYSRTSESLTRNYQEASFAQFSQLGYNLDRLIDEAARIHMMIGTNSLLQDFFDKAEFADPSEVQNAQYPCLSRLST